MWEEIDFVKVWDYLILFNMVYLGNSEKYSKVEVWVEGGWEREGNEEGKGNYWNF